MQDETNPYRSPAAPTGKGLPDNLDLSANEASAGDGKLVTLAVFANSAEAHITRSILELNGIQSHVVNDSSVNGIFGSSMSAASTGFGVEVMIHQSNSKRAFELLSETKHDTPIPEWTCKCGETVDEGFSVCWNCLAEFPENVPVD